jgi:hypothetical protein
MVREASSTAEALNLNVIGVAEVVNAAQTEAALKV